ncbi:MAG TPA: dephospho-CoA kinase [Spirochaetaceae bacterium]|nr:dephospho-CoA kinase [Spirochaetaceae bacterium]
MCIIGLTGGYCAGKNEVANILVRYGWDVIDVDKLGHVALLQVSDQLINTFGDSIRKEDGSLDRKKLGEIVFSDKKKLNILESIVHPLTLSLLDQEIEKAQENRVKKICINAALLYRFPQVKCCKAVIEVRAPLYQRIMRAQERDHVSMAGALQRIENQKYLWEMRPHEGIPIYMLWNTRTFADLEADTAVILRKIVGDDRS